MAIWSEFKDVASKRRSGQRFTELKNRFQVAAVVTTNYNDI